MTPSLQPSEATDAGGQTAPTAYDEVAYPTAIFSQTAPDRMATIARLAGLSPPPVANARVLEIGTGDGMNLLALAAAFPQARFTGFDLAPTAIARGERWRALAGLDNIELRVLDILDAGTQLEGPFDYIIAHGIYAWVPPEVRTATMALIGALLAPDGVAFLSYNAMPGGHLRQVLRDALLLQVGDLHGAERWRAAREYLSALAAEPEGRENPAQAALRDAAKHTLDKPWSVLCHDDLGAHFHPQSVMDVAAAAAENGLQFLGDADREQMGDAFLPENQVPESDATGQLVRLLQARDYHDFRFFRQTLLVRDSVTPQRRIDLNALDELFAVTRCRRDGEGMFRMNANVFEVQDAPLAEALGRLVDARPARLKVRDLVDTPARRIALFEMFDAGLIDLCTDAEPYAVEVSERPAASGLIRAMLAEGLENICTLDHRLMTITEHAPRHLLAHLDGTRDRAALAVVAGEFGLNGDEALDRGLRTLVTEGLIAT
ncbi:class I SAM-dependent methyltransferase [Sphingomonas sp. S2-65]|uniref:class I SAM-dependent methyltransferase n=1 Tax=Sphingomonas sp. S2-65 TaxID=2903960 RepID=UPI001F1665AD|nr:class I SAM-dependent methyltransferase [Sphingomonas sp. S2-65]UYY57224.1 class I SAM-dependent methyltransferase [Sphingomonas sp. S2-65]